MNKKIVIGALISSLMIGTAMADKPQEVAQELALVKVPAVQAIEAAQKLFPGQTYDVDLEKTFVGNFWEVKIFTTDQRFIQAYVDAKTGEVVAADETAFIKGKKKKSRTHFENGMPVQQ